MPWLTQLAAVARRTGYPVTEVSGWTSRGHGPQPSVRGIVCHHTAGASGGGDYPSLAVVRSGRTGLAGPLSQFGLGRSGRIYVVAAGRCWHNAPSTSSLHTNSASLGIEAENDGRQSWPAAQLDAYKRLCAELCQEFGLSASRVKAHREVNTGKPDPHSISMTGFRADVARLMNGDDDMATPKEIWTWDNIPAPINPATGKPYNPTNTDWRPDSYLRETYMQLRTLRREVAAMASRSPDVDVEAVAAAILADLTPERIAAAIPAELAEQVVTALGTRISNPPKE